jgi:sugar lactone lactonase YvrE
VIGSGPPFLLPDGIGVEPDAQLVLVDVALGAVVRVDPVSGDRTTVSDSTTGRGPRLDFLQGIAVEATGQLVVTGFVPFQWSVGRVNPVSGRRTIVSNATRGQGPPFAFPAGIAVEATGPLVVADRSLQAVVRVDSRRGTRTIVSGCTAVDILTRTCVGEVIGGGSPFVSPVGIAVEADGHLVVTDGLFPDSTNPSVVRVDAVSGDRTIVSNPTTGNGQRFQVVVGIAVEATGQLVVVDEELAAVVRVDPISGDRTSVSNATTGQGLPFAFPAGIAVEAPGHLVVLDRGLRGVVRVDPVTGDRTLVSR